MGVFDDKEYDKMDWISQAVEPIKSPLNDILVNLPDEFDITYSLYNQMRQGSYALSLNVATVISWLASIKNIKFDYSDSDTLDECFEFVVEHGTEIDFETRQLRGSIKLIKTKHQLDERDLEKTLCTKGRNHLRENLDTRGEEANLDRHNDVIDILDCVHPSRRTRSVRKKVKGIIAIVNDIMNNNRWNLKDVGLADRVCDWIVAYINYGSMPAFANLCKLKLMTHKGLPIYSMAEDKI
jgi:hypothetical protein